GRFSEKRCDPSRRCARNASAALENFACYPPKDFFDSIGQTRTSALVTVRSALHPVNGHRREQATKAERMRGPPSHAEIAKFYRSRADVRRPTKSSSSPISPSTLHWQG